MDALLKKDKTKVQVSVEIDVDDMEGFRITPVVSFSVPQFSCTTAELSYLASSQCFRSRSGCQR